MKKKISLFISLFSIFNAKADSPFTKILTLTENVRDVVLKTPEGNPMPSHEYILSAEQSDQVIRLAKIDETTQAMLSAGEKNSDCDYDDQSAVDLKTRVSKHPFQIGALLVTSDSKYEQDLLKKSPFAGEYNNYIMQLIFKKGFIQFGRFGTMDKFDPKALDLASVDTLINRYKSEHPEKKFDSLNILEKEQLLRTYTEDYLGEKLPTGLLLKDFVHQSLIKDAGHWQETLALVKDNLNSQQKIELVSMFGGDFLARYNTKRLNGGDNEKGKYFNTEQLLSSANQYTDGGVCRDIALAQVQMLNTLGFKNNYVVSYKSLDRIHSTVITTDPVSGKVIKYNYDDVSISKKGSDTSVLSQDNSIPSMGLGYRIYDVNGKPVTSIPSEISQILNEVTGENIQHDFNPKNYSISSVAFKNSLVDGSLFTGRTSAGESITGVALYKNENINSNVSIGIGAALSNVKANKSQWTTDQNNLYLRINSEVKSPTIKFGEADSDLFIGGKAEGLFSENHQKSTIWNQEMSADGQKDLKGEIYLGGESSYVTPSKNTEIKSKIYLNYYPDVSHVAKNDQLSPVLDSVVINTTATSKINNDILGLLDTAIIMKNYGTSVVLKGTVEDSKNNTKYSAGASAPISSDMPSFLPGGESRIFLGMDKKFKNLMFSIQYEKNLDTNSNNLNLKGEAKF